MSKGDIAILKDKLGTHVVRLLLTTSEGAVVCKEGDQYRSIEELRQNDLCWFSYFDELKPLVKASYYEYPKS